MLVCFLIERLLLEIKIVVERLSLQVFLSKSAELLFKPFSFLIDLEPSRVFLLKSSFSFLCVLVFSITILVEFLKFLKPGLGHVFDILVDLIKFLVFLLNRVSEFPVLWSVKTSSVLDSFLQCFIFRPYRKLLLLLLFNKLLHLSNFKLKIVNIFIICDLLFLHFFFGIILHLVCFLQGFLCKNKVFLDVLIHILKLI